MSKLPIVLALALSTAGASYADAPPKPDLRLHQLPPAAAPGEDPTFRYDLRWELPSTGVLLGAWIAADLATSRLAPRSCVMCETRGPNGQGGVNALDLSTRNALRWGNTHTADVASTVIGFAIVPAAALGLDLLVSGGDGGLRRFAVDVMLITESAVVAAALTDVAKFTVGRARPYVQDLPAGAPFNAENNLSFFSGHTSFAFAVASAAGTIATMRGYKYAPIVWVVGMALAATTGYLRMAADQHYLTDVLMGAAVGTAVGVAVPYLHKKKWSDKVPSLGGGRYPEGGGYVTASWKW